MFPRMVSRGPGRAKGSWVWLGFPRSPGGPEGWTRPEASRTTRQEGPPQATVPERPPAAGFLSRGEAALGPGRCKGHQGHLEGRGGHLLVILCSAPALTKPLTHHAGAAGHRPGEEQLQHSYHQVCAPQSLEHPWDPQALPGHCKRVKRAELGRERRRHGTGG